jgi:hypothetical protein
MGNVFSESLPTHDDARRAAQLAAREQETPAKQQTSPGKTNAGAGMKRPRRATMVLTCRWRG